MGIYSKNVRGANEVRQAEHFARANLKKVSNGLMAPGILQTSDMSVTPLLVRQGSILRVRITAATYIAFSDDPSLLSGVNSSFSATHVIELFTAGTYEIACTGDFAMASSNPARIELLQDA